MLGTRLGFDLWPWFPVGGTSVEVTLTGASITSAIGAVVPGTAVDVIGQSTTTTAGSMAFGVSTTLAGASGTTATGIVVPQVVFTLGGQEVQVSYGSLTYSVEGQVTVTLTGVQITSAVGVVAVSRTLGITGSAVLAFEGTVGYRPIFALVGQSATASYGTLSYSADTSVTVVLTGVQITSAVGLLGYGLSAAVGSGAVVSSAGSLFYDLATGLEGTAATAFCGTVTVEREFALAGLVALSYRGRLRSEGTVMIGMPFWFKGDQIMQAWANGLLIEAVHFNNAQVWP